VARRTTDKTNYAWRQHIPAAMGRAVHWALASALILLLMTGLDGALHKSPAEAESADRDSARQIPPPARSRAAGDVKTELSAGTLRATLTAAKPGALFGAGSSVFTDITVSNESDSADAQADLMLEAEAGEIAGVTGKNLATVENGAVRMVRIGDLAKGEAQTIVVELKVTDAPQIGERGESRMNVTLRQPTDPKYETKVITNTTKKSYCRAYATSRSWNRSRRRCVRWSRRNVTRKKEIRVPVIETAAAIEGPSDETILRWPVSNCAQAYYGAITKVREANSDAMGAALKRARSRDRSRPGGWLFRPADENSATRKLNRMARVFVRSRGIDPEMSSQRNYGWVSQKVATDLRGYLKQDAHPAICTGAIGFVGFFDGRMKDFWQRAERFSKAANDARAIAVEKVAKASDIVSATPQSSETSAEIVSSTNTAAPQKPQLQALISRLAALTDDGALKDDVAQSPSPYATLKVMSAWLKKKKDPPLAKDQTAALRRALGAIEAAEYLGLVAGQYQDLRNTIEGSIVAIRDAHGAHCRCGG